MMALVAGYGVAGLVVYLVLRWLCCIQLQDNDRRREHEAFLAEHPDWPRSRTNADKGREDDLPKINPNDPHAHHERMIRERIEQMRRDRQL